MKYSRVFQYLAIRLLPTALWRRLFLGRPRRPLLKAPWCNSYTQLKYYVS